MPKSEVDALIVGAGFSGMYMLYALLKLGLNVCVVEEGTDVGGTWYWNRYPGARCDIVSMDYSYSFSDELQQEWNWTHKYSTQEQILEYAAYVTEKFDLREHMEFGTKVLSADYDEAIKRWYVVTDGNLNYSTKYLILATGTLSSVNKPNFEGLDSYEGEWYATGRWPKHAVNFDGKTVGVIGTGSSAIQAIPVIAEQAKQLTVFQRTANYSVPAHNRLLDSDEIANIKANYSDYRAVAKQNRAGNAFARIGTQSALEVDERERNKEYEQRWREGGLGFGAAYTDLGTSADANETAAEFVRAKIRELVHDPQTASLLSPRNTIGCKRLCADTNYFETYNRSNVRLIDLQQDPIQHLLPGGIQTLNNVFSLDVIVFAIGFDAMTGALLAIDIKGKNDKKLKDKWIDGPRSYLGLLTAGFPNMFTITGPGSPSVLTNMFSAIEQHVNWTTQCIKFMQESGYTEIEAQSEAENQWMDHVEEVANQTLRYTCNSWYVGANIPGKKRVFMPYAGGIPLYIEKCDEIVSAGYKGFRLA